MLCHSEGNNEIRFIGNTSFAVGMLTDPWVGKFTGWDTDIGPL